MLDFSAARSQHVPDILIDHLHAPLSSEPNILPLKIPEYSEAAHSLKQHQ